MRESVREERMCEGEWGEWEKRVREHVTCIHVLVHTNTLYVMQCNTIQVSRNCFGWGLNHNTHAHVWVSQQFKEREKREREGS